MAWLYMLPILVALTFVVVHVARGGKLTTRGSARPLAVGLVAVAALAAAGFLMAAVLNA